MGFRKCLHTFAKCCFARCLQPEAAKEEIAALSPELGNALGDASDLDLELCCAPVSLGAEQNYFLVPIRPVYAMSLIDRQLSSSDMFGGDPTVLLRWENVYYRKGTTSHKILKAPGRILWYVSHSQKQIVAVSHLDEVVIDTPKELLRRFKRFGILGWAELYQMCAGNTSMELMALRFSHTFAFRRRIPLNEMRAVYAEDECGLTVQLPTSMPASRFQKLFKLGFSGLLMNTEMRPVIISLKPYYADMLFEGLKKVELRRRIASHLSNRDVYIYVSSPVKELRGGFRVGQVWEGSPEDVWKLVEDLSTITRPEFDDYFHGQAVAYALEVTNVWEYESPVSLSWLRDHIDGFVVPQSWRYARSEEHDAFQQIRRRPIKEGEKDTNRVEGL